MLPNNNTFSTGKLNQIILYFPWKGLSTCFCMFFFLFLLEVLYCIENRVSSSEWMRFLFFHLLFQEVPLNLNILWSYESLCKNHEKNTGFALESHLSQHALGLAPYRAIIRGNVSYSMVVIIF